MLRGISRRLALRKTPLHRLNRVGCVGFRYKSTGPGVKNANDKYELDDTMQQIMNINYDNGNDVGFDTFMECFNATKQTTIAPMRSGYDDSEFEQKPIQFKLWEKLNYYQEDWLPVNKLPSTPEEEAALVEALEKSGKKGVTVVSREIDETTFQILHQREPEFVANPKRKSQYPTRQIFLHDEYVKIARESNVVLIFQANLGTTALSEFCAKMETTGMKVKKIVRHKIAARAFKDIGDPSSREFASLFNGPVSMAYCTCSDDELVTRLKDALATDKRQVNVFFYGAKVQDCVLDSDDMKSLSSFGSTVAIRSTLIQAINSPATQLVRTLAYPQNNLVKALDFKLKQEGVDSSETEGEEGDSEKGGEAEAETPAS